jgi:hypothetical protein
MTQTQVKAGMLATDAVETAKIKDANVTTAKLATNAVTAVKITNGVITAAKMATGAITLPLNYLSGCILSNDTDTDHDINITAGEARDAADGADLVLASEQTKRIDASWATGGDAGGLSSSLTLGNNTWYHVHLITVSGTVEVGFDTSVTAANLVTDHSASSYRRIGSVLTNGSANIIGFTQDGDEFLWNIQVEDVDTSNPGTSAVTPTLSTPLGVKVRAICTFLFEDLTPTGVTYFLVTSPDQTDSTPTVSIHDVETDTTFKRAQFSKTVRTNTSSQIRYRSEESAGDVSVDIQTSGWLDRRGK